jgi:hypothetical protein
MSKPMGNPHNVYREGYGWITVEEDENHRVRRERAEQAQQQLAEMMKDQPEVTVTEAPHSITLTVTYKSKMKHFWAMTLDKARQKANQWLAIEGYAEGL